MINSKKEIDKVRKVKGKGKGKAKGEGKYKKTKKDDIHVFENFNEIDLDYELAKQIEREEIEKMQKEENMPFEVYLDYELAKQIEREEIEKMQKEESIPFEVYLDYELAKQIEREEREKIKKGKRADHFNQTKKDEIDIIENFNKINLDYELAKQIKREEEDTFKQTKNCEICLEDFSLLDGTNYFLNCNCIIHNTCFDNMVKIAIESNNLPVKCPNCKIPVHPNFIIDSINNANPHLLEKYNKFSISNFLMNNSDEYSSCPTPGCEYVFFFRQGEFNFLCPLCHKNYCLNCKDKWHAGLTCQQYKDSRDEKKLDNQFFQFVRGAKFKMCPKCKYWVEKTMGCNHMRCRCGADFCYLCGGFMNMNSNHTCRR